MEEGGFGEEARREGYSGGRAGGGGGVRENSASFKPPLFRET